MIYSTFRRISDIIISLLGLIVFSPLFLIIGIMIKKEDGGPLFYKGLRVGQNKKNFYMLKFRTMVVDAEKRGGPTTSNSDSRITKTGAFLRKYKLDELPQLINVLKGDMSLIGPRPEIASEVELYDPEWNIIFDVKPGITDMSSIEFRNEGEIIANSGIADAHLAYRSLIQPKKLALQRDYVLNRSLLLDAKILFSTIRVVIRD